MAGGANGGSREIRDRSTRREVGKAVREEVAKELRKEVEVVKEVGKGVRSRQQEGWTEKEG